MSKSFKKTARLAVGAALLLGVGFGALSVHAQTAPVPGHQAVEARKAVFTLIGNNFRPLAAVLKGDVAYDAADADKRISRLVFLSGLVDESFPDASNLGEPDTKAKADVWSNRADFDKKSKDFQTHLAALQQVNATEKSGSEAFKTALAAVGQDCKGCHESFKVK
jgi:cytochrome c556